MKISLQGQAEAQVPGKAARRAAWSRCTIRVFLRGVRLRAPTPILAWKRPNNFVYVFYRKLISFAFCSTFTTTTFGETQLYEMSKESGRIGHFGSIFREIYDFIFLVPQKINSISAKYVFQGQNRSISQPSALARRLLQSRNWPW